MVEETVWKAIVPITRDGSAASVFGRGEILVRRVDKLSGDHVFLFHKNLVPSSECFFQDDEGTPADDDRHDDIDDSLHSLFRALRQREKIIEDIVPAGDKRCSRDEQHRHKGYPGISDFSRVDN